MGYFVFVGLLVVALVVGLLASQMATTTSKSMIAGSTIAGVFILFLIVTAFCATDTVSAGNIGIKKQFGNLVGTTGSGLVMHAPWQSVSSVSVRNELRTYDMGGGNAAVSSDSQAVYLTIQVNYSLQRAGAVQVYKNTGGQFVERILDPAVYQDTKEVTAGYRAVDFAQNREVIRQQIEHKLQADVGTIKDETTGKRIAAITINSVALKNVDFTPALKQAIEQTVEANQQAKRAQAQVAIKQAEAQQVVAEAKGRAEATLTQARADAESNRLKQRTLTPLLIQQQAINKLNPRVSVIVCDSGKQCIPNTVLSTAGR